jgi:hypothetical protein
MTYIYHDILIQNTFTDLKILCAANSSIPPLSTLPQTLHTIKRFIASIVLPFPECHAIEILSMYFFRCAVRHALKALNTFQVFSDILKS